MGKVNRKLKAKAKQALATVASKHNKQTGKGNDDQKSLLHKTQTARETITKKEKIRKKHTGLMEKFKNIAKQRKEEASQKKRQKTAITGDLKPLKDALPSLDELFRLSKDRDKLRTGGVEKSSQEVDVKLSAKKKLNKKKREFISKVNAFEALLKDPDFKKNPRATISYHVKYTNGLID